MVKRKALSSSTIASVGFDPAIGVLEVEFTSGRTYRYYAVPVRVAAALLAAGSPGTFFNEHIRPRYPAREIDD